MTQSLSALERVGGSLNPSAPTSSNHSPNPEKLVLIVDDDLAVLRVLSQVVAWHGFEILEAADAETALGLLGIWPVDVLVTDCDLPELGGAEIARWAAHWRPAIRVICMSGDHGNRAAAEATGATFLPKPFEFERLIAEIDPPTNVIDFAPTAAAVLD